MPMPAWGWAVGEPGGGGRGGQGPRVSLTLPSGFLLDLPAG